MTMGASAVAGSAVVSGAGGLAQAGLGLFAVIVLILLLAWGARRAGLVRQGAPGTMKVVASTMLGARQRLVIVEVGETWLVLGVSPGEIRTLHTMPADRSAGGPGQPQLTSTGSFAEKLLRSMQENLKK